VRDVITNRTMSVKARLVEMGAVADLWEAKRRGRSH
jgi:hypothetical protein